MRRRWCSGNRCSLCGRLTVPSVDNFGMSYMGCPSCVVVDIDPYSRVVPEPAKEQS